MPDIRGPRPRKVPSHSMDQNPTPRVTQTYTFAMIPEWVLDHESLNGNDIRTFCALSRYAGGGAAFPGVETLAKRCRFSASTARRSLNALEAVGAVRISGQKFRGIHTANLYELAGEEPFDPEDSDPERRRQKECGARRSDHPSTTDRAENTLSPVEGQPYHPREGSPITGERGKERESLEREPSEGELFADFAADASLPVRSAPKAKPTDDPLVAEAHRLATLAFEQSPKPLCRGGFPAVMKLLETVLRAEYDAGAVEDAIVTGQIKTWTTAGLSFHLDRASNPRRNGQQQSLQATRDAYVKAIAQMEEAI